MARNRLFLILFIVTLTLGLFASAEIAKPAQAVTNNSHVISTASTGDHYIYESSYQNPGFFANGLYWIFYENYPQMCEGQAGCLYYVTSYDGVSWSSPNQVATLGNSGIHVTDSDWSVANSGNQVFYARYNESAFDSDCNRALLYGSGTISGASIVWQPEQIVRTPSSTETFPSDVISVDSNNQVWIGYLDNNHCGNGLETPHIIHANNAVLSSPPLSASFIVSAPDPIVGQTVQFNGTATGGKPGYSYLWSFGDGSTGTGQNVTHSYLLLGRFTVTLQTMDSSTLQQIVSSSQTVLVGAILPNQPPSLTVPSSTNVKVGTPFNFGLSASDADGESVTVTTSQIPFGASFSNSSRQFTWTPTASQANQTWAITFNATDNGNPNLSVTRQVLVYVSPLWAGDISLPATTLSQSISGNWHVDVAVLGVGQIYAAYWADQYPLFGRLYDGSSWQGEDQISLPNQATDVNSFIFGSGNTVYAVYFDANKGTLNAGIKPPSQTWQQNVIGPGEARSVCGLLGNVPPSPSCSNPHRYSLPFTATFDLTSGLTYVFWYNQTENVIDEWSGSGGTWRSTPGAFTTQSSGPEYPISSFHYSTNVNGIDSFGIVWIDGISAPYRVNFGLETIGPVPPFQQDTSWNPQVSCTPIVVTIEQILGSQDNASSGGATESGSIFNPGILAKSPGDAKRWLTPSSFTSTLTGWQPGGPPCQITNADGQVVGAFVEIRGVQRGPLLNEDFSVRFDPVNGAGPYPNPKGYNDTTFNIFTPGYGVCSATNTTGCMHTIHVEFDHDWKAASYCGPGTVCDPYQMAQQAPGFNNLGQKTPAALIDVQGFIYWDPDHAGEPSHAFSGWEIHPLTAWRLSCPQSTGVYCTPGYTLSSSPSVLTAIPGQKVNSTISVKTFNLFSGRLNLTASVSPTNPSDPAVTLNPSTLIPSLCNACDAANSTLTIVPGSTSSGTYIVTVTTCNGSPQCSTTITVQVQGFSLVANPISLAIPAGGSANTTITISSLGSFVGQVNLTSIVTGCGGCGFTATFTPTSLNLVQGGKANATLTIRAGSQTGNAVIKAIGTSGSLNSSTTISISGVDFFVTANPATSSVLTNRPANSTITVGAINGFTGTVSLTKAVPSGLVCGLTPTVISLTSTATSGSSSLSCSGTPGVYNVIITANSTGLSHSTTFAVTVQDYTITANPQGLMTDVGAQSASTIRISAIDGFTGTVSISQNGGSACSLSILSLQLTTTTTTATATLTCTYSSVGNNLVQVSSRSSSLSHNATIAFQIVDFAISATQPSPTIDAGAAATSTVTLTALNGYNRTVTLSISAPAGITCFASPLKLVLQTTPVTSVLSCNSSIAADYSVTVTGTNGTLSRATSALLFHVIDFSLTTNISTLTLGVGQNSQAPVLQAGSLNGFVGTLSITVTVSASGPSASAIFGSLKVPLGGNLTALNVNAGQIAGLYTLNITASRGSLSHFRTITLRVTLSIPTITTSLSSTNPTVGTPVTDSATLSGATTTAGGTVIYYLFHNGGCIAPASSLFSVLVNNDVIPNTRPVIFNATGSYSFNATYSGDNNNGPASSVCEPLSVMQATTGITTNLSSNSIQVGQSVTDTATLSGAFQAAGSVNYILFVGSASCSGSSSTVSTVPVTGGVVPSSRSVTFNSTNPGGYSFQASYSGDPNNKPADSGCEALTVAPKGGVTITGALSSSSIVVGNNVTDSSTLAGATATATGTVSYYAFPNVNCAASGSVVSTVSVTNSIVPNSRRVTFNSTGSFSFDAIYSGDANNAGATSICQPLTVNKASPTISTSLSPTTITVGGSVTDSATLTNGYNAGGTATYEYFANAGCSGTAITVGNPVTVANGIVPNSASQTFSVAGSYTWNVIYNGDANNNPATSTCESLVVNKTSPTLATTLSATNPVVGSSVTDSTVMTNSFNAGNTVTYDLFPNGACSAQGTPISTVTVINGVVPNSRPVTFNSTGAFSFTAVYSGDANNNGAVSSCEPLTVLKASPTVTTTLSTATVLVGGVAYDSATMAGSYNAGGTATYAVFSNGLCNAPGTTVSTVSVTNGSVPNSRPVLFNSTGNYAFQVNYLGDANNNPASSACEPLSVGTARVTVSTSLSSANIVVGQSATDSATLSGQSSNAGGTIQYQVFGSGTCGGPGSDSSIVTVTNGVVPNSRAVTFNSTGSFGFEAIYSGDSNNAPATSPCEPLSVNKAITSLTTTLSATTITAGGSVFDESKFTGAYHATGTVTYEYFTGSSCSGTSTTVGTIVSVTNSIIPNSTSQGFTIAGAYSWNAIYSGDSNNTASNSTCELLTVNKTSPTLTTNLSSTTPTVGTSVTDSASLTNSIQATGSVTYREFTGAACVGSSSIVSTVPVTNGLVPSSRAVLFNSTGSYAFQAVYSGDPNNNVAQSLCEPLTVQDATPTITTSISATSIIAGSSATDSATLTGGYQASGTVQYNLFANGACTGPARIVSSVTVANGIVPNSRQVVFNATGSYSFNATYSGDINNAPAFSACEPLVVQQTNTAIATSLSANAIHVGQSSTDSAVLTNFFQAGGSVTYLLFAGSSACAGTGVAISTVLVTNGVVPNSRSVIFNSTNQNGYSFQASYSGDANNKPAASGCEPLTVLPKGGVTIATVLSSNIIIVGRNVNASATLAGTTQTAGGTTTYYDFSNGNCAGTGTAISVVTVTNSAVPPSRNVTFNATGTYSLDGIYSGDSNNAGATSNCQSLSVNKAGPTIGTTLSASAITVGGSAKDSSILIGGYGPGGTVTYEYFTSSTCSGTSITVGAQVTVANGVVPDSITQLFNSAGSYGWNAVYSGDSNNNPSTSACEPLTVNKTTPTLSTAVSSPSPTVGTSDTDSATMANSYSAGGTVTYSLFANNVCSGSGTVVSIVGVSNGGVPVSRAVTFNATGGYSFQATYNGDANNSPATSTCEALNVQKASPTVVTSLAFNNIVVGNTAADSATLSSTFRPSGTLQYNLFANGACTSPSSPVSIVAIVTNSAPSSRAVVFNSTGTYSFNAVYSGDTNNNGVSSSCEQLTVVKATPILKTSLTSSTITVGQSTSDTATLSASYQATGTVTYTLFIGSSTCGGTGSSVSSQTVTNGVVPSSRNVLFNATNSGGYSWTAAYSGDSNNTGANSACEPLTVNPTTGVVISTAPSSSSIIVGNTATDSASLAGTTGNAGGTVTFSVFSNGSCAGSGSIASIVSVTNAVVPNSRLVLFNSTGSFGFIGVYSGDANNAGATGTCEPLTVQKASPSLVTNLVAATITVGGSAIDSSTLSNSYQASGTVTYEYFTGGVCTGSSTPVGSPVTVTTGIVPGSTSQPFNTAGTYSWNAIYSGDSNNNGATSQCEPLTVNKASPTVSTILSSTTPIVGTSVTDSASLASSFSPTGTVTYAVFTNGACTAPGSTVSIVTLTSAIVPDSRSVVFNSTGSYSFQAVYGGDANNNIATSSCEPLAVGKASPSIATTLAPSTSITVGQPATDSAVLSNGYHASGTVQYNLFTNAACSQPFAVVSIVSASNGVTPSSRSVTFNSTGGYSFEAMYSGDANNGPATSACESITIVKASPTITTTLSGASITVGTSITDSSTLSGTFQPTGTVTYELFIGATCAGTPVSTSAATVASNVIPNSRPVQINSTGSWSFNAGYSGDSNNIGATSQCEPFNTDKTNPTLTTTLSSSSIIVDGSVFDTAALSNSFQASGTVTYEFFSGSTCAGTATTVGTAVQVTNSVVPNSISEAFNSAGLYSFQAVYSGDLNNNGITSICEPLTVNPVQNITLSTSLSQTNPIVGTPVTDTASLTGTTPNAGGTVTYNVFTNGACTPQGAQVSKVTVTNGNAPNSRSVTFNSTGSYSFNAVYSGDSNNAAATSICEPLTIVKTNPTIGTSLSSSSIIVGGSVTDSATLTNSYQAAGTVTYEFFAGNACVGTPTTVGTAVIVTNGIIPNSVSQPFNTAGQYSWNAVYSGDANNNVATSLCESLTVAKVSGDSISTSLSTTTPVVGTSAADSSTLSNAFQPTGTVVYSIFANSGCTSTGTIVSTVVIVNGIIPNSRLVTFNSTQSYSFVATYNGDNNNNPATSFCEPLTVQRASPTIATQLGSSTVTVGGSVADSAAMSNGYTPSGTMTYEFFSGSTCTGPATAVGSPALVTAGVVQSSSPEAFTSVGSYGWNAVYSGDANNNVATSACEPLTVIKASPVVTTTPSLLNPIVGTSVTDSATIASGFNAGGAVAYYYFVNGGCSGSGISFSTVQVTNGIVPPSQQQVFGAAGSYAFQAVYSGDGNNNGATSGCEPFTVQKASPTISTTQSATSIVVGQSASDSAILANAFSASGTVTYTVFSNPSCTPTGTIPSVVQVTAGNVPNSRQVTFNATGSYSFQASYSGDANNNIATSPCEPLNILKATPTITSAISSTVVQVDQSAFDSATLTSFYQAGGTVNYILYANANCNPTGDSVSIVTVANGVISNSRSVTFNATGSYSFQASYSGDANNFGVTSGCAPMSVVPAGPSITTVLSQIQIVVGSTVADSATLQGTTSTPSGTVTYYDFNNGNCANAGTSVSTVTLASGGVPNSRAVTFNSTGSFSFNAAYSGDSKNKAALSPCEALTVSKATPSLSTILASGIIAVGNSETDSAQISGGYNAAGSVTYEFFTGASCSGPATSVGSPVIVANGIVPNSIGQVFVVAGSYSWNAIYSGDSNNNGSTSACEPLSVSRATPTLTTTLSNTGAVIGSSVYDSATLANNFNAGGTVTYTDYANGGCTGLGATVAMVNVVIGSVPNSRSVLLNNTGSYSFQAVYSGDANNAISTSICEPLTVAKALSSTTTSVSQSSPSITGSTAHDIATVTGVSSFAPSGTLTYSLYSNVACNNPVSTTQTVTLTSTGVVPNSASTGPLAAGSYSFQATYNGDANYASSSSSCEPFTVAAATSTTATAVLQSSPNIVGSVATDSATVTGIPGFAPAGTLVYNFFNGNACAGTTLTTQTVTLSGGLVPNSGPTVSLGAGSYSFQAAYSGDNNYQPSIGNCEPFTVSKATPVTTTAATQTTPRVTGSTAYDTATLTGVSGFAPTGSYVYTFFTDGVCTSPASTQTVTVSGGSISSSASTTPLAAGSYSFQGTYNGDGNYTSAISSCESFAVGKANSSTSTTTVQSSPGLTGSTAYDKATVTGVNGFTATGSYVYSLYTNGICTAPASTSQTVALSGGVVPNSAATNTLGAGSYSFQGAYSGDSNYQASTSLCEQFTVAKAIPTVATTVVSETTTSFHDTSAITGVSGFNPTGTLVYSRFNDGTCTGTALTMQTVSLFNGAVPVSASTGNLGAGSYSFQGAYSGDNNYAASTSSCEPFTAGRNASSSSTTAVNDSTTTSTGASFHDTASIVVSGVTPTGTYLYNFFNNALCNAPALTSQNVTLSGGLAPNSLSTGPLAAGSYSFQGKYSGDSNYYSSTSSCEPFTITKAVSTTATVVVQSATSVTGSNAYDTATVTGVTSFAPTGTLVYSLFTDSACTTPASSSQTVTLTSGIVPASTNTGALGAGSYGFQATYSGDNNYLQSTSPCEPLIIGKAGSSTTTIVTPAVVAVSLPAIAGSSVYDSATVNGVSGFIPTGVLEYSFFSNIGCTGSPVTTQTVTLSGGAAPSSAATSPLGAGSFSFQATYGGDSNYLSSTSACEPLTVSKAAVVVNVSVTSTITVGNFATLLGTLKGGFPSTGVTGTVAYRQYTSAGCVGAGTTVSTASVGSGDNVATVSVTPPHSGTFSYQVFYSGDSNNNQTTSGCQSLTVLPTISVPSGPISITAGNTINFVVNASDPSESVTLTADTLPAGASFGTVTPYVDHTVSSIFRWTPPSDSPAGYYNVTFTATVNGVSANSEVTIHVIAVTKAAPLPLLSYSIFGVVGFLAVLGAAILLRRLQNPRRRSEPSE